MTVEKAQARHIPELAALLTDVFIDDPAMKEYVAWSGNPRRALEGFFRAELTYFYVPRGVVDMIREDGEILGVALWTDPRRPVRRRDSLRMLPSLIRALGRSFPRAAYLASFDDAVTPKFPHWYLFTLVVSPVARGRGIGGRLLDHGIARAGDFPIYLESTTEGSRRLYARKGFLVLGEIPSPLAHPEVGMWRPGVQA